MVREQAQKLGITAKVVHLPNPRVEMEEHYYNVVHDNLLGLGLHPGFLSDELIDSMLKKISEARNRIRMETIQPNVSWSAGAPELDGRLRVVTSTGGR
jgi:UDP-sulfoquinovose synthase